MVERSADARLRTTEWEDIQYKHGNCVGQYRDKEYEIMMQKIKDENPDMHLQAYDALEEKVADKKERGGFDHDEDEDESEDDDGKVGLMDDDEDELLAQLRTKRRAEMMSKQSTNKFGSICFLNPRTKEDGAKAYLEEITEASKVNSSNGRGLWVIATLVADEQETCAVLVKSVLEPLAQTHRNIKFVVAPAAAMIPNFPRKETPLTLIYRDGVMYRQVKGIAEWGNDIKQSSSKGKDPLSLKSGEKFLQKLGILAAGDVDSDDDEDEGSKSIHGSKYYTKMNY